MKPSSSLITTGTNGAATRITIDRSISVNALLVQPFAGTGPWYVCSSADANASTGVGILGQMLTLDAVFACPQSQSGNNQISPSDYWILGTVTADSCTVATWIA